MKRLTPNPNITCNHGFQINHFPERLFSANRANLLAKTSKETSNASQERSKDTVTEASQEGSEASDESGQETAKEGNETSEDVGDEAKQRVEDGSKLRTDAEDGDERLDGEEDLREEGSDESQGAVEVSRVGVDAGSIEDLLEDVGELEVHGLELRSDVLDGLVLGDLAGLDLGEGGVDGTGVLLDGGESVVQDVLEAGDVVDGLGALAGGGDAVDNLADTEVLVAGAEDEVGQLLDGVGDFIAAHGLGSGHDGGSHGGDSNERELHFECERKCVRECSGSRLKMLSVKENDSECG